MTAPYRPLGTRARPRRRRAHAARALRRSWPPVAPPRSRLTGVADEVRRALRFDFAGVEQTPAAALRIALQNARLVAAALLCAVVVPRLPQPARLLADVVLAVVLAANAGLVGVALGAYGARLAVATAPHLPVELAALSLAGGAYMHARRQPLGAVELAAVAATCALLLVIAATLETYVALGGVR